MQQSAADLTTLRRKLRAGGVEAGSTQVTLKFEDGSNYPLPGSVQFSEVTVNQDTGTVTLRARFPNPQGLLLPGTFVNAAFDQAVESNAFLVPQQAVQRDFDGSAYVMLVGKNNTAMRRKVVTTRSYGSNWVVTSGLARGEKVILQGLNGLKQGAQIVPVPANSPQDPTKAPAGPAKGQAGSQKQGG
jgi:membrane fusion protein (multidrug efflux system)